MRRPLHYSHIGPYLLRNVETITTPLPFETNVTRERCQSNTPKHRDRDDRNGGAVRRQWGRFQTITDERKTCSYQVLGSPRVM